MTLETVSLKPTVWLRCVDDTFILWDQHKYKNSLKVIQISRHLKKVRGYNGQITTGTNRRWELLTVNNDNTNRN